MTSDYEVLASQMVARFESLYFDPTMTKDIKDAAVQGALGVQRELANHLMESE